MDTSKEYILQCEKAEEIQKLLSYGEGCQFYRIGTNKTSIWLPRQDQLQELYKQYTKEDAWTDWGILDIFHEWALNNRMKKWSMEQLWLAFVMKEKYNKTWDGEKWTK